MGVIMTIGAHWKIRLPASHAPGVFYEITKIHLECRNPPCLVDMKYTLIGIATTIQPGIFCGKGLLTLSQPSFNTAIRFM